MRTYRLAAGRGFPPIVVPLCERCGELKMLKQIAWGVGSFVVGVAVTVVAAIGIEALLSPEQARASASVGVTGVLLLGAVIPWLALRRRRAAFHRRFSAVWVVGSTPDKIRLGVRATELSDRIAALSGIASALAADPYRAPAAPLEPAHHGRVAVVSPYTLVVLVGLGMIGGGIVEYIDLGATERNGETIRRMWVEILIYKAIGRGGVLAMFLFAGGLVTFAGGLGLWRRLRTR